MYKSSKILMKMVVLRRENLNESRRIRFEDFSNLI
jgi:hypothetical protein